MFKDVHFDFAVLLTLLTLITGLGWLLDKLWLAKRRRALIGASEDRPGWFIEFCRSFFPVIGIVLLLRSFVVEPFRIPSGSMIPTLLVGDFILVNKFTYGLRDPVFHWRFLGSGEPKRGDVVVFRWPGDPSIDYIKRVIGLPGDHIAYRDKVLYVNGQRMNQSPDGQFDTHTQGAPISMRLEEQLGDVKHPILINPEQPGTPFPQYMTEFVVPPGQYFMMGDNRDNSSDSRFWGTVPERNLVGKAFMIWMSWDSNAGRPALSRVGKSIH